MYVCLCAYVCLRCDLNDYNVFLFIEEYNETNTTATNHILRINSGVQTEKRYPVGLKLI